AIGGGPLDVHHPAGGGLTLVKPSRPFGIPYGTLLPVGVEAMLTAGRCISATHRAMAAVRHMGTVMTTGEAAGAAAGLAVSADRTPRGIDVIRLRTILKNAGALVDQ